MKKVSAFGVPVFTAQGKSKNPPTVVNEMNAKLEQLGISSDDIITIQVEQDFYHVFYKTE